MEKKETPEGTLFILNLELKKGKKDKIYFKKGDNPGDLALEFCQKNKLNIKVYDFIVEALKEKLNLVLSERDEKSDKKEISSTSNELSGSEWRQRYYNTSPKSPLSSERKKKRMIIYEKSPTTLVSGDAYENVLSRLKKINYMENEYDYSDKALKKNIFSEDNIANVNYSPQNPDKELFIQNNYQNSLKKIIDKTINETRRGKAISSYMNDKTDHEELKSLKRDIRNCYDPKIKNVTERLYTDAKQRTNRKKKIMKENKSMDISRRQSRINLFEDNPHKTRERLIKTTNRLYYWGLKKEKLKEKMLNEAREQKELLKEIELRDTPVINNVSRMIAKSKRNKTDDVVDRLLKKGEDLKERKEKLKYIHEYIEEKKFSFQPKVDKM